MGGSKVKFPHRNLYKISKFFAEYPEAMIAICIFTWRPSQLEYVDKFSVFFGTKFWKNNKNLNVS